MPILKEIGFNVRYIPSKEIEPLIFGKSEEERNIITVEDYNKNFKQRNFEFRIQTRNIAAFYERCMNSYKNDKCWKILIECVPSVTREPYAESGVYTVQVVFDVDDFFKLNDFDKKRRTLELIKIGVEEVIEKEGWDKLIFDNAYETIVSDNYINKWVWKKKKNNSTRKYIAKVLCEHGIYSCDISILITDNNGQIVKEELVVSEKPDEWMYAKYFGDLKWVSNNEVVLISKNNNNEFLVKVE